MVPVRDILSDLEQLEDDFIAIVLLKRLQGKRKTKKSNRAARTVWVNDYLKERHTKGRYFVDFQDMRNTPAVFVENFRMTPEQFDELHRLLENALSPKLNTRPSDIISSKEKLAITLEYMASGSLVRHIGSVYRVSKQETSLIINQTCNAILQTLTKDYIPKLTTEFWKMISSRFESKWNLPHCLGSIDGKHCAIKCPSKSGSTFYNYKGYFSLILMAVADADYKFTYFDVGAYGSEGDSGVFRECDFWKALTNKKLTLPPPKLIYNRVLPPFFVADDAFPLDKHIMKPFKPPNKNTSLPEDERIFNYRLSRARRTVENAFGILCSRWMCLARSMLVGPNLAQKIISACCLLHNYLMTVGRESYIVPGFTDALTDDGRVIDGFWRQSVRENSMLQNSYEGSTFGRIPTNAKEIRNHLKEYVNSDEGRIPWQDQAVSFN